MIDSCTRSPGALGSVGRRGKAYLRTLAVLVSAVCLALPSTAGGAPRQNRGGRGGAALGRPQEASYRLRQLELFEQVLGETIEEYVQRRAQQRLEAELSAEESRRPERARTTAERQQDAAAPTEPSKETGGFTVKVGRPVAAHGVVIDGYGVLVTVQRPRVAVVPREVERRLAAPFGVFSFGSTGEEGAAVFTPAVIELRARMIEDSLRQLEVLLEREQAENEAAEQIERRRAQIERVRALLEELAAGEGDEDTEHERREGDAGAAQREQAAGAAASGERPRRLHAGDRYRTGEDGPWARWLERQRSLSGMLERAEDMITRAVTDAAIDTLAHYGAIIRGIPDEAHLSVLVAPPSGPELPHRFRESRTPQEYVISVRYGDIRELDEGAIDLHQFRERVRVRGRLGEEIPHAPSAPEGDRR